MRARIAFRLNAPLRGREKANGKQDHDRMHEQGNYRKLDFAAADFFSQIFRRASNHLARQENPKN